MERRKNAIKKMSLSKRKASFRRNLDCEIIGL